MNQLWQCIFWVAVYKNDQCVSLTRAGMVCIFTVFSFLFLVTVCKQVGSLISKSV